eukprot:1593384-Prymnesium_polylepis.1
MPAPSCAFEVSGFTRLRTWGLQSDGTMAQEQASLHMTPTPAASDASQHKVTLLFNQSLWISNLHVKDGRFTVKEYQWQEVDRTFVSMMITVGLNQQIRETVDVECAAPRSPQACGTACRARAPESGLRDQPCGQERSACRLPRTDAAAAVAPPTSRTPRPVLATALTADPAVVAVAVVAVASRPAALAFGAERTLRED